MATGHRLTIRSIDPDPRIQAITASATQLGLPPIGDIGIADVVLIDADLDADARQRLGAVLVDPLLQTGSWDVPTGRAVEVTTLAGVTNSDADAVIRAAGIIGVAVRTAGTARRIEFDNEVSEAVIDDLVDPPHRQPHRRTVDPRGDRVEPAALRRRRRWGRGRADSLARRRVAARRRSFPVAVTRPRGTARDPGVLREARSRPDRRRAGDPRPDVERALRPQDVPGGDRSARRRRP